MSRRRSKVESKFNIGPKLASTKRAIYAGSFLQKKLPHRNITKKCASKKTIHASMYDRDKIVPSKCPSVVTKTKPVYKSAKIGLLEFFNYKNVASMSELDRHNCLLSAVTNVVPISIFRKLISASILLNKTNPELGNIYKKDAEWLQKQPEYLEGHEIKYMVKDKKSRSSKSGLYVINEKTTVKQGSGSRKGSKRGSKIGRGHSVRIRYKGKHTLKHTLKHSIKTK
jgi:hypothetical protein